MQLGLLTLDDLKDYGRGAEDLSLTNGEIKQILCHCGEKYLLTCPVAVMF